MSMINDALRRASRAARGGDHAVPPPPPLPAPVEDQLPPSPAPLAASAFPMPPPLALPEDSLPPALDGEEPSGGRKNKLQLALAFLLVLAVGAVAVLNHFSKQKETQTVDVSANAVTKKILPHASALQTAAQTLAVVSNRAAAANPPVAAVAAPAAVPPPAPVVAAPPPKFPSLRLQSIFYRPSNPSVMINGRTLFLEDEIQGVTVADIQPSSVTLVLSGHTNVLTLR
jgi:hypothetical protein